MASDNATQSRPPSAVYAKWEGRVIYFAVFFLNPLAIVIYLSLLSPIGGLARSLLAVALIGALVGVVLGSASVRVVWSREEGVLRVRNLASRYAVDLADISCVEFRRRPRWTWLLPGYHTGGTYCLIVQGPGATEGVVPMVATIGAWSSDSSLKDMSAFFSNLGLKVILNRSVRSG